MREIARRTTIAIALPLVACLLLASLLALQLWRDVQQAQRVEQLIEVAVSVSAVISDLQDERGMSAAVVSGVTAFSRQLSAQRDATDEQVRELARLLNQHADRRGVMAVQSRAQAALAELPDIRERVDREHIEPLAKVASYTRIIDQLLDTLYVVALDVEVADLAVQMVNFQRLQAFVEDASLERGLGAILLGTKGLSQTHYQLFIKNLEAQREQLDQMAEAAPQSMDRQIYNIISTSPYAPEMEVFRARIVQRQQVAEPDSQAALAWFRLASAYIAEIDESLNLWVDSLHDTAGEKMQRATVNYIGLGTVLLLLLGSVTGISMTLARRLVGKIAAERSNAERIRFLGRHDPLTKLPNRYYFQELLEAEQRATMEHKGMLALHLLDIVDFKGVNRVWGIEIGDAVIQCVAQRLRQRLPTGCQLARLHSDQFAVLQPAITSKKAAESLARSFINALAEPISVGDRQLSIQTRIGITLYPPNATTYNMLMRNADLARQHVAAGGNYAFYISEMYEKYLAARELVRDLRRAVMSNEFLLEYQPKVELSSNRLCGAEALIRWQHPQKGLLGPDQFIPEAERSGLIADIGHWVFAETCRQLQAWRQAGLQPPVVAVNLSPVQIRQTDLLAHFADALERYEVDPAWLELEVTETALIGDMKKTLDVLQQLRDMGVSLTIDDFGTGYSSLSYLQQLPAQSLKLDRSFVTVLGDSPQTEHIVDAVITLSHGLGMDVVAEGVENKLQLEMLKDKGCDIAQGFWLSKPLSAGELGKWLAPL
ncbi:bifunctional diguanylate cyclase/phosphodiesterase [Marinimicrobium sp. ABcell2]|uniref:putative bifunctional diguanylate cyclase/phosphodiesterase n=1 Tax=Marinimicrobium sp. ABcell2 TaxID=3069751 RepID=UPI0027B291F9|nr:EAL domain-containing protein [Marinimicrobium sp. ABcell2]MDQ2075147.1 EAL domain-containing protein [Marinimicrobium sp. ABcell2]